MSPSHLIALNLTGAGKVKSRIHGIVLQKRHWFLIGLAVVGLVLGDVPAGLAFADAPAQDAPKIFIAFGFHVNLYHSFRNDTNDQSGFGNDISMIRGIIQTLDRWNAKGIPVKGVWDFDNFFTLQEILPQYAPDIIYDIRRRIRANGDEVLLMSYNNGMVSAMNEQELDDAVRWAISNPWQSGVQDLFGGYSPIIRPQEMMTTPGNFSAYKRFGIKAVALYYSATPFDAFRMFSRPLTRAEAHNPLYYRHPETKEEMLVIPTYHFGDLLEHVSLRHWVGELQGLQQRGELQQDALIFINFDADSELWRGFDLPWILGWLPNTGGLDALVDEIHDVPGVRFTTLNDYLAQHRPVGTVYFSQDTADGNFDGFNSWAEKADSSYHWTAIQRSRHVCTAAAKAMEMLNDAINTSELDTLMAFSDLKRLRALSTTHFGMATPFVARQRDLVITRLTADLDNDSDQMERLIAEGFRKYLRHNPMRLNAEHDTVHLDTLLVLHQGREEIAGGSRFLRIAPPRGYQEGMRLGLVRSDGKILPTVNLGVREDQTGLSRINLFLPGVGAGDGIYGLCTLPEAVDHAGGDGQWSIGVDQNNLSNGRIGIGFQEGQIEGIYLDGVRQADAGSLMPYIRWGHQTFQAGKTIRSEFHRTDKHCVSLRMAGPVPGPMKQTQAPGWMDYRLTLIGDLPYLMVNARIKYPATEKRDLFKPAKPGLIRLLDLNWEEVAPAEIRFSLPATKDDPMVILKQNYLGISSQYALDYFRHSDQNLDLDNVNNHITESFVGIVAGGHGMAVAMDTSVQSNFAFTPLKMHFDRRQSKFTVRANPFGTYYGRQYQPPTWGNGNGFELTREVGEQFASAGPTYNNVQQDFSLLLAFFNARQIPERIRRDLVDFAHPPLVVSANQLPLERDRRSETPLKVPQGFVAAVTQDSVQFSWDNDHNPADHYRIHCGTMPGHYKVVYPATGNSLRVTAYLNGEPFVRGRRYVATIEKVSANGKTSGCAREIHFTMQAVQTKRPRIPLKLLLKILWADVYALLT